MQLYSKLKASGVGLTEHSPARTQQEGQLPSSSRLMEHPSASPHSFRNKGSYLNKRDELLSTGRTTYRTDLAVSRSRSPMPNQFQQRSPLK